MSLPQQLGPKCGNPYQILGVGFKATEAQIKKAFRELSLQLHPDKRKGGLSSAEIQKLDKKFHDIAEARSFLLDPEHAEDRRKYDDLLASQALRRNEDERREKNMSENRKRMRDELERKMQSVKKKSNAEDGMGGEIHVSRVDKMEDLRKDSERMREAYDYRQSQENQKASDALRIRQKLELERKQIRLKWSRSRLGSQTEHGIANLLSERFGDVDKVEFIGSKGNAALVTFRDPSSCKACIHAYRYSDDMRATAVGRSHDIDDDGSATRNLRSERDRESVEERKMRQAAERERLERQIQSEEDASESGQELNGASHRHTTHDNIAERLEHTFPPKFPPILLEEGKVMTPFERLEYLEKEIVKKLMTA